MSKLFTTNGSTRALLDVSSGSVAAMDQLKEALTESLASVSRTLIENSLGSTQGSTQPSQPTEKKAA